VATAATTAITTLVRDGVSVIALLGYMIYLNAFLATIFLVVGPVMASSVRFAARRFRRISKRIQDRVGQLTHVAQEAVGGQRVVKAFGGQRYEADRFSEINEKTRQLQMRMVATEAASVPLVQFISATAIAIIVYLASMEAVRAEITVGTFMSFVVAMGLLLPPVKRLTKVNVYLQKGIIAAESLFELIDSEAEPDHGQQVITRARGRVAYHQVSYTYQRAKAPALRDIDLAIEPGETLALVGRSGSGKTTLASLLPRFYDPQAGRITIDGVDIRELTLSSLRRQISLVSQEVVLFNASVAHNIAYGAPAEISRAELERVATSAHALEFIQALPQGFDTRVGDRGVLLSGGQRQRLAIARAMLKDAPILILDEATSSLDTQSERHIQAALEKLMQARTTLVIAHRLSTIENASRIVVLHEGRVVEQGGHSELLALDGHYARLHRMQFRDRTQPEGPETPG
jgi:subfamily B ATP-binding cassette protein MsbA